MMVKGVSASLALSALGRPASLRMRKSRMLRPRTMPKDFSMLLIGSYLGGHDTRELENGEWKLGKRVGLDGQRLMVEGWESKAKVKRGREERSSESGEQTKRWRFSSS